MTQASLNRLNPSIAPCCAAVGCVLALMASCTSQVELGERDDQIKGAGPPVCGDAVVEAGYEECDDGNTEDGDGCSATCKIAAGWVCPAPGEPCEPFSVAACGNGVLDTGEECDDGNAVGGDGCGVTCEIEPGWVCEPETPGEPCVFVPVCGDGVVTEEEECDDGVNSGEYGQCGPDCQLGPRCGDGVIQAQYEECDDGVNDGGPGECAPGCVIGGD